MTKTWFLPMEGQWQVMTMLQGQGMDRVCESVCGSCRGLALSPLIPEMLFSWSFELK